MTGGIFAVLDDISMLLDDAAMITKISIKKTAPILGDDLAVNAEKAAGFQASRELPVLWKITKGSLKNKLIILPIVFLLSAIAPWLIIPILLLGGTYLAFEGAEKVYHYLVQRFSKTNHKQIKKKMSEDEKVKSAIMTDFILSIEIVVIALGTVLDQPFMIQVIAVCIVAIIATIGVYGIVALIVRLDDIGFYLIQTSEEDTVKDKIGELLVASLPKIIKALTIIGTVAMFMVAGGIFSHNLEFVHHLHVESFNYVPSLLFDIALGGIIGLVAIFIYKKMIKSFI